jgi:HK97 family phage major capsid protein
MPADKTETAAAMDQAAILAGAPQIAQDPPPGARIIDTPMLTRYGTVERAEAPGLGEADDRRVELSFSSEDPYLRWFGYEILSHDAEDLRLDWIASSRAPLLLQHYHGEQIGVVEKAWIDSKEKKARAVVRFSSAQQASEVLADVRDNIRTNVSVGYRVHSMILEEENEDGPDKYRVNDWTPLEVSIVSVPADTTVGIGRGMETPPDSERSPRPYKTQVFTRADLAPATKEKQMPETVEVKETKTDSIDVAAATEKARKAETARVRELMALGDKFNQADNARAAIEAGTSVEAFRVQLMDAMPTAKPVEQTAELGLTPKEVKRFSFLRAIDHLVNPNSRAEFEAAAFEREVSEACAQQLRTSPKGIFVPADVLRQPLLSQPAARQHPTGMLQRLIDDHQRDMVVGTDAAGGYLVATDLLSGSFIELLRNAMATRALGATIMGGLVGNVAIPRQTGGATAYWIAENGTTTESTPAVDQVALTPKTVAAYTEYSRRLLKQSSIDVEAFLRGDLATTLALALDLAGIAGTGADEQPEGILATTGIGAVAGGTNGLAPAWAHIVDLETAVAVDNAAIGNLAYLTNAPVRGQLKKTDKGTDTGQFVWENSPVPGEGLLNGYRAAVSNQVPSDLTKGTSEDVCSAIIFGNWRDLIYGLWGALDLQVNPYSLDTTGAVRVTAMQDADVAVRHAESFAAMQDALTA